MNRGSALLFHLAAQSSSSPAVRRLWNVCNKQSDFARVASFPCPATAGSPYEQGDFC
jgi:hypothetical protein